MTDIDILMMDGCTRREAERHLKNGSVVFEGEDFENHFNDYMDEWSIYEKDREEYRQMISDKKPATDCGVVEKDGKVWYILYVL